MSEIRYDKLGRRIPEYNRSVANKKGAKTSKEKHGTDWHSRIGTRGGSVRTRGYLGHLKDQGRIDELRAIQKKGYDARISKSNASDDKATET